MKSRLRRILPVVAILALALPACNDNLDDEDASDNIVSIVSFEPLVGDSDVADSSTIGDSYRTDVVSVSMSGDARNAAATTFQNDVILTSYAVQFIPLDGVLDSLVPPDWSASINLQVAANSSVTFTIDIVRAQDKASGGVLNDLDCTIAVGAACGSIRRAAVTVTFTGADIAGKPVSVTGFLTVQFSDFVDPCGSDDQGLFVEGAFTRPRGGV